MNYFQQCQQCQKAQVNPGCNNEKDVLNTMKIKENNNRNPFCPEEAFMLGNFFSSLYVPYCGMTNYPVCPQNQRQALLVQVMMLEFNLHELNLYLDTHPNDQEALNRFHEFHHAVEDARKKYEQQFGPLAILSIHEKEVPWVWNNGPWPWQRQ